MSTSAAGSSVDSIALSDVLPLPEGDDQYPIEFIETNQAIKILESAESVHIGLCDPSDHDLRQRLQNFHNKKAVFFAIDPAELAGYLSLKLSGSDGSDTSTAAAVDNRLLLDRLANDAPIVNLVNGVFIDAIRQSASDIHIEVFSNELVVRYRIDGYLRIVRRLERSKYRAVSTRIKIMANLNIMESRMPQDGRITVHLSGREIDLRVSIVPIADGESIVLRILDKRKTPLEMEELGMSPHDIRRLEQVCSLPNGLVLATGPTGSGKTTTLNAILNRIKDDTRKIIAIEDPIEYVNHGVNQIQTNELIGLTFSTLLRRVLRQDPNIILVGEIRDSETAEIAVRAALTGHLVLSTLHTNDALSVVPRLMNIGVEPYLIAAVLRASLAQRLVRKLCLDCRNPIEPSERMQQLCDHYGIPIVSVYEARGCSSCHETGFSGRIGLYETLVLDSTLEKLIISGAGAEDLLEDAISNGMDLLVVDGLRKIADGTTTMDEVEKVVSI